MRSKRFPSRRGEILYFSLNLISAREVGANYFVGTVFVASATAKGENVRSRFAGGSVF